MKENEKLRHAFIASTVSLIVTGILFIITLFAVLVQISSVIEETKANKCDLNCLMQENEKPLTECKK